MRARETHDKDTTLKSTPALTCLHCPETWLCALPSRSRLVSTAYRKESSILVCIARLFQDHRPCGPSQLSNWEGLPRRVRLPLHMGSKKTCMLI